MVSTRGVKLKFVDGERVLCYEPDPTKAKVLYDSKVLRVVVSKDHRGRKTVEYLIHFQGWNSSWDRCVSEDYVLKDTAENRQLQRDLAEKAQLQLGAYLYRRDKKRNRKLSERVNESLQQHQQWSEDGSSGSPALMDTDDTQGITSSSESDSSLDDDSVPLELTQNLRYWMEYDHEMITKKDKLIRLPAEPNIVSILEGYLKHYSTCQVCMEKPKTRHRHSQLGFTKNKTDIDHKSLNVCKEMLDGIRVYFDFTLSDLLLYNQERQQACIYGLKSTIIKNEIDVNHVDIKIEPEYDVKIEDSEEFVHLPKLVSEDNNCTYDEAVHSPDSINGSRRSSVGLQHLHNDKDQHVSGPLPRRRLRSCRISQHSESAVDNTDLSTNGVSFDTVAVKQEYSGNMSSIGSNASESSCPLAQISDWKIIPDEVRQQQPYLPSLIYGAVHLTRLFVKLPELLWAANIPDSKLKLLLQHMDMFVDYLDEHREWFGEKMYIDSNHT